MNKEIQKRKLFSKNRKTNLILLIAGLLGFISGGVAIQFPGLVALIGGVGGLIKNRKIDEKDKKMSWTVLVSIVLLVIGVVSLFVLGLINPIKSLYRSR
jgi:cytochrome c biogenesis protein CcdA